LHTTLAITAMVRELPAVYHDVRKHLCGARLDGYREFCQVLFLHREFGQDLVKAALETAVASGSVSFTAIRQALLNLTSPKGLVRSRFQRP